MRPRWWFLGSFVTWVVGWFMVGWDRPLRMLASMLLVILSGYLSERAFQVRREREAEQRIDARLRELERLRSGR